MSDVYRIRSLEERVGDVEYALEDTVSWSEFEELKSSMDELRDELNALREIVDELEERLNKIETRLWKVENTIRVRA